MDIRSHSRVLAGLALLAGSPAGAAPLVVVGGDGDSEAAVATAAWATQAPPESLEPIDLADHMTPGEVVVLGQGSWTPCADAPTHDLSAQLAAARKAWMMARVEEAELALQRLNHEVACAPEPREPALVFEAYLFQGVLLTVAGDPEAAADSFLRAALAEPGQGWDAQYAPAHGQAQFEATRTGSRVARPATLGLALGEGVGEGVGHVDGRPASEVSPLSPGPHAVHVGDQRGWLVLPPGAASIWVGPGAGPEDVGRSFVEQPRVIGSLFNGPEPLEGPVLLAMDQGVWYGHPDAGAALQSLTLVPQPRAPGPRRVLAAGGGGILAAGVGSALFFAHQANGLALACASGNDNGATCQQQEGEHITASARTVLGRRVAAAGGVVLGAGVVLELQAGHRTRRARTVNQHVLAPAPVVAGAG